MSMTPFLALPAEIQHIIDEDSPLYGLSQADLVRRKAEIAFVFEGTIAVRFAMLRPNGTALPHCPFDLLVAQFLLLVYQTLGLTMEFRTSFVPQEIKFDHRCVSILALAVLALRIRPVLMPSNVVFTNIRHHSAVSQF